MWREDFLVGKSAPAVTTVELLVVKQVNVAPERSEVMPALDLTPIADQDPTPAANPDVTAPASSHVHTTGQTMSTEHVLSCGATLTLHNPSTPPGISTPTAATDSTVTSVCREKHTIDQVDNGGSMTDIFINNFGGSDGIIQVMKRTRKKHSDAGVKRGPRKKPATPATA